MESYEYGQLKNEKKSSEDVFKSKKTDEFIDIVSNFIDISFYII